MILSGMDTSDVTDLLNDYYSIENTLRRRGFDIKGGEDLDRVIQTMELFYESLKSFSFRQILKAVYESDSGMSRKDLLEKVPNLTANSLASKISTLVTEGAISVSDGVECFRKIGGKEYSTTFEWFVSEIVKREMCGISRINVKIKNLKCGGDYDVISRLEDLLVHFECKSGSIKNISKNDISRFIARYKELAPSMSILALDTNGLPDEFKTKFNNADWDYYGLQSRSPKRRRVKGRGVFYELFPRISVLTSEGNLVGNIKFAINHFFAYVKPYGLNKPGQDYFERFYDEHEV